MPRKMNGTLPRELGEWNSEEVEPEEPKTVPGPAENVILREHHENILLGTRQEMQQQIDQLQLACQHLSQQNSEYYEIIKNLSRALGK